MVSLTGAGGTKLSDTTRGVGRHPRAHAGGGREPGAGLVQVGGGRAPRWATVALLTVILVALAEISLAEGSAPPRLGLSARATGEGLVVDRVLSAGWAWDAGLRPGQVVVAIDGRPVGGGADVAAIAVARALTVRAGDGTELVASVATAVDWGPTRHPFAFLLIAACFVAAGGAVFLLSDDRRVARLTLGWATAWAVALIVALALPSGRAWPLALMYAAVGAFGGTTFLLFLAFPVDRLRGHAGRWAAAGCVGVHLLLLAAYGWVLVADSAAYALLQPVHYAVLIGEFTGAILLLVGAGAAIHRRVEVRRPLALLTLGTAAGLLPFTLLNLVPHLLGVGYLAPPDVVILSAGLLPLGLGAAVLSRQFLGVSRLASRGLVALAVWLGLLGLYSLGFGALGRLVGADPLSPLAALRSPVLGIAVVAATFPLAQGRLRRALEARLFPDAYDYAATLERLGAEIARLAGVDEIAAHVLGRLGATLDLTWAALALRPDDEPAWLRHWGSLPAGLDADALLGPVDGPGDSRVAGTAWAALIAPLVAEGSAIGAIALGQKRRDAELLAGDRALVATLAPLVATALRTALLVRRLEGQVAALGARERELAALSGRLLTAQEEERRRIALDLHDDPLQRTVLLARDLGAAPARDRRALEDIIGSLRALGAGLRPPILDDLGLVAGLEWLVEDVRARADFAVALTAEWPAEPRGGRLDPALETALYRVAQEALNNCLKHAGATWVALLLRREGARIVLRVADDGQGPPGRGACRGQRPFGLGLVGMRERLRPWGGGVAVSARPGGGTVVEATVPVGGERG